MIPVPGLQDLEFCVAQPVAEGIQRSAFKVPVGPVGHGIILEVRQLLHAVVEGQRQLPAGIHLAEQNARQGSASGLSGIPGENLRVPLGNVQIAAGRDHGHQLLCLLLQHGQQLPLAFRQLQILLVPAEVLVPGVAFLAFQSGVQPDAGDGHVGDLGVHRRFRHPVLRLGQPAGPVLEQVASQAVKHPDPVLLAVGPDPGQEGHIPAARSVIVSLQGHHAVRVRADHRDATDLFGIQRQRSVVLQQHHALFRRLPGQRGMFVRIHGRHRDPVILAVGIKQAQQGPRCHQPDTRPRDVRFRNQSFLQGFEDVQVGIPAVQVASVADRQRRAFRRGPGNMVVHMEVLDRPAVADHMSPESPLLPQRVLQQRFRSAGRFPVHPVVGAHHALYLGLLDGRLKRGQIGFRHVLLAGPGVKFMTERLRPGMDCEMLAARGGLQVFPVSLKPLNKPDAQPAGQVGILAVGFVSPAPSWIPENVDIRAPYGQPLVDVPVPVGALPVVFCPGFLGNGLCDFLLHFFIEHRSHADRLRKHRRRSRPGHAMQHFVPPVVSRNAQPGNRRRVISQLACLFFDRHPADQFLRCSPGFFSVPHGFFSFLFLMDLSVFSWYHRLLLFSMPSGFLSFSIFAIPETASYCAVTSAR